MKNNLMRKGSINMLKKIITVFLIIKHMRTRLTNIIYKDSINEFIQLLKEDQYASRFNRNKN